MSEEQVVTKKPPSAEREQVPNADSTIETHEKKKKVSE